MLLCFNLPYCSSIGLQWFMVALVLPRPVQVAYGLSDEQMRRWGLYISKPLGPEESVRGQGQGQYASALVQYIEHPLID